MNNSPQNKRRFTIGKKIWTGFGLLIFLTMVNFVLTFRTLHKSRTINDDINLVYNPSVEYIDKLHLLIVNSKMYICNWVFVQSGRKNPDKLQLIKIIRGDFPKLRRDIEHISHFWNANERNKINKLFVEMEELFALHKTIMDKLVTFENYEDPNIIFYARNQLEGGDVDIKTRYILEELQEIIIAHTAAASEASDQMNHSFEVLQMVVVSSGFMLVLGGLTIAFFTTTTIVKPIQEVRKILGGMSKGILPSEEIKSYNDEIGDMTNALNQLINGLHSTTNFSREIGSGNFDSKYEPLSEHDTLGFALLKMRDDLRANERELERKVAERTEEVVAQKEQLERTSLIIQENSLRIQHLYNDVTDSIKYALRIQNSILPPVSYVKKYIKDAFFLYKPKDIISGDFYWFEEQIDDFFIGAVDCTGHGVPGALMSMVGHNILTRAVTDHGLLKPADILDELNESVSKALRTGQEDAAGSKDGMDIAICRINYKQNIMQYAGAFNPIYRIRDGELEEFKANKFPIGHYVEDPSLKYTNIDFELREDDIYYIFTDGYADQFGGPKGKKFMYKQFRELLLQIHTLPFEEQRQALDDAILNWMQDEPQLDDILVIGFKPL
ncbi:MAG: Nitrate/nitrite sensor protein NarX [Bacteroidota bacterium]